jgi:hypothetical protein
MAQGSDTRPAPSATGTFETTPLAHVLVYARNKRLTGVLELRADDEREGTIGFHRGAIVHARTYPPSTYFGGVAYELGLIDAETLAETLHELAMSRLRHGEILVERGVITRDQRDGALAEQMCRKVHQLFALREESASSRRRRMSPPCSRGTSLRAFRSSTARRSRRSVSRRRRGTSWPRSRRRR